MCLRRAVKPDDATRFGWEAEDKILVASGER